jgi:hypothetical protein
MDIRFNCPRCGQQLTVEKQGAGMLALNFSGLFMLDRSLLLGLRNQTVGCLG